MERDALIAEIEAFAAQVGWKPSTVCVRAVQNGHLYKRMKDDGGSCSITVAEKLRRYIADYSTSSGPAA